MNIDGKKRKTRLDITHQYIDQQCCTSTRTWDCHLWLGHHHEHCDRKCFNVGPTWPICHLTLVPRIRQTPAGQHGDTFYLLLKENKTLIPFRRENCKPRNLTIYNLLTRSGSPVTKHHPCQIQWKILLQTGLLASYQPLARANLNANFSGKFFTAPNMKDCTQEVTNNPINHSQC